MSKKISFFLIIIVFILTGCSTQLNHQKSIDLFVGVQMPIYKTKEEISKCNSVGLQIVHQILDRNNKPADLNLLDSLNTHYEILNSRINFYIKSIDSLQEIDKELNIKEKSSKYLITVRGMFNECHVFLAKICKTGISNENKKQVYENMALIKEADKMGEELHKTLSQFVEKYKITDEELQLLK